MSVTRGSRSATAHAMRVPGPAQTLGLWISGGTSTTSGRRASVARVRVHHSHDGGGAQPTGRFTQASLRWSAATSRRSSVANTFPLRLARVHAILPKPPSPASIRERVAGAGLAGGLGVRTALLLSAEVQDHLLLLLLHARGVEERHLLRYVRHGDNPNLVLRAAAGCSHTYLWLETDAPAAAACSRGCRWRQVLQPVAGTTCRLQQLQRGARADPSISYSSDKDTAGFGASPSWVTPLRSRRPLTPSWRRRQSPQRCGKHISPQCTLVSCSEGVNPSWKGCVMSCHTFVRKRPALGTPGCLELRMIIRSY